MKSFLNMNMKSFLNPFLYSFGGALRHPPAGGPRRRPGLPLLLTVAFLTASLLALGAWLAVADAPPPPNFSVSVSGGSFTPSGALCPGDSATAPLTGGLSTTTAGQECQITDGSESWGFSVLPGAQFSQSGLAGTFHAPTAGQVPPTLSADCPDATQPVGTLTATNGSGSNGSGSNGSGAAAGVWQFTVQATVGFDSPNCGGQQSLSGTTVVYVDTNANDFALTADGPGDLYQGQGGTASVSVNPTCHFHGAVTVTFSPPAGVTVSPATLTFAAAGDGSYAPKDVSISVAANAPHGAKDIGMTGTSASPALTDTGDISFTVLCARQWSAGPPISVTVTGGTNTVQPGTAATFSVSASDTDLLSVDGGTPTSQPDTVSYAWSATGGSFSGSTSGQSASWTAPLTSGTYTVTCTVHDSNGGNMSPGDCPDSHDGPATQAFTVVVPGKKWDAGAPIQGGALTGPATVTALPGASVGVGVSAATDTDHWTQGSQQGMAADVVTYKWTASGGSFSGGTTSRSASWTAPTAPGDYTLTCTVDDLPTAVVSPDTGTRDDDAVVSSVTVHVPAKVWDTGDPIQGGLMTAPQDQTGATAPVDVSVPVGASTVCAVQLASDTDHWSYSDASGNVLQQGTAADVVTYKWTASGGSFSGSTTGQGATWTAPSAPGDYTLTCTVNDLPTAVVAPDTGTRDDDAVVSSVTVHVRAPRHWTAGAPITAGDIQGSGQIALGDTAYLSLDASDTDHWTDGAGNSGDDPDVVTYSWSCSAGQFVTYDAAGNPHSSATTTDPGATWVAPSAATSGVTISCTVNDLPTAVLTPDDGTRDDAASVTKTLTVNVVDASAQRVAKLRYSTDGLDDFDPNKTWTDVPNSGDPGYPLTVNQGDDVEFKAIKTLPNLPWPAGKPAWGGEADAGDTGETEDVVFVNASTSATDLKAVTAKCGNTITAYIKVVKTYFLSVSSNKNEVLAGGNSDLSSCTISTTLTDYAGDPVNGVQINITSTYLNSDNTVGTTPAGSLNSNGLTTDANGETTCYLTANAQPTTVGIASVSATASISNCQINVSPAAVAFNPPVASSTLSAWAGESGMQKSLCSVTLTFGGAIVPNRTLRFVVLHISQVNSDNTETIIDNGQPQDWAVFENPTQVTSPDGTCSTNLIWTATDFGNYKIYYDIEDDAFKY